jgi:hypothetical protein
MESPANGEWIYRELADLRSAWDRDARCFGEATALTTLLDGLEDLEQRIGFSSEEPDAPPTNRLPA